MNFKTITKNWVSTLFNIAGMSIALAVFMITMVQVEWSWTYDRNYPGSRQTALLEHSLMSEGEWSMRFCRPLIEETKTASPDILCVGTFSPRSDAEFYQENDRDHKVTLSLSEADSSYFDVFPFEFVSGSIRDFGANSAVISEESARKLFGNEDAVGRMAFTSDGLKVSIVAVYKDFPKNCSVRNGIISNIGKGYLDDPSEWSFMCYMRLSDESKKDEVIASIAEKWLPLVSSPDSDTEENRKELLTKTRVSILHDAYFERDLHSANIKGSRPITRILFVIALMVILIAIINFVNFSFARIPFEIKGINTRKILGAEKSSLIGTQLLRAAITAMISFALAVLLMHVASGTSISGFISGSIKPFDNPGILLLAAAIAILCAVLAGIAPALYSTSQPTSTVLKGSYSMSVKGKALRNILVSLQFILSFIFVIFTLFINRQTRFMQDSDMGFNDEQVLEIDLGWKVGEKKDAYENKLRQNPSITDVTFSDSRLVSLGRMTWGRNYEGDIPFYAEVLPVSVNFLDFFGIEIVDGRDFTPSDDSNPCGTMIVNEKLLSEYPGIHIGSKIAGHSEEGNAEIVGVAKDFNFKPLQYPVSPMIKYNWGSDPWRVFSESYVKMAPGANAREVMDYIRKTISEIDPEQSKENVAVGFMDDRIQQLYDSETNLGRLISMASVVAIIITIIGIIGLVFFETQSLRKEIAVRRVNGATVEDILSMINRKYILLAIGSFAVASPVVYFIIRTWRNNFAYKAGIPVWIFLLALLLVVLLTVLVVTLQSLKAASANPVESLKNE